MNFAKAMNAFTFMTLFLPLAETKSYRPFQFHQYTTGLGHYGQGKPTSRHK